MTKPLIRIISEGVLGNKTRVLSEDGTDISSSIQEISLSIKVGELNKAQLTVLGVTGEIVAVVDSIKERVIPPPLPKAELLFTVQDPVRRFGRMRSRWTLVKQDPLHGWGAFEDEIASGWCGPISALKIREPISE